MIVVTSLPSITDVCSWVRTPAQPYLLASVNIVYSLEVSGYFKIGAEIRTVWLKFCESSDDPAAKLSALGGLGARS